MRRARLRRLDSPPGPALREAARAAGRNHSLPLDRPRIGLTDDMFLANKPAEGT